MSKTTVFATGVQPGDVIDDANGGEYERYGKVVTASRSGASVHATTQSGQPLMFGVWDRVLVQR